MKVSEDESILQPNLRTQNQHNGDNTPSEVTSQQDSISEPLGSPSSPAYAGSQSAGHSPAPAPVVLGCSENQDTAEQLLLKLHALQSAEGLSVVATRTQQARVSEEAFAEALRCLERGEVTAAVKLLKVAQAACPANKPQAQAKIILLLGRCQQMIGRAKSPVFATTAPIHKDPVSLSLPSANYMQAASRGAASRNDGDMQKADQSFQSGLEALDRLVYCLSARRMIKTHPFLIHVTRQERCNFQLQSILAPYIRQLQTRVSCLCFWP